MAVLDHVVINALRETDAAEALFAALGFQLTPRGYHTLGSVNHLMMTPGAYLEIVGVPPEGKQRQEVLDSPRGLNGIVLQIEDADACYARLKEAGFDPLEPRGFSRPVTIDGTEHEASFRTVRLTPDFFGGGRIYFCHHLTPDLVWRPEWLDHPNGFAAIDRVELESPDPAGTADRIARAFGGTRVGSGAVELEDSVIAVAAGPAERMVATGLVFHALDGLVDRAVAAGVSVSEASANRVTLTLPSLDTVLLCRSAG